MTVINTFSNVNRDKVRTAVVTMLSRGFSVSTHCGGVQVDWGFQEFPTLIDAQGFALQWIAPTQLLVKVLD